MIFTEGVLTRRIDPKPSTGYGVLRPKIGFSHVGKRVPDMDDTRWI